jgi:ATP-dependent RNA helicase DeaD
MDLANAASRMDLAPYYLLLEPLLERFSPQELATAAVALLSGGVSPEETARTEPAPLPQQPTDLPEWTRLFVSIGEMEGVTPGSLLGTLAGESDVDGACFGKIEIRDTYSLVEVTPPMAEKVIKAVNGVSIRGRSTRVDYDRGGKGRGSGDAGKGVRGKRGGRGPTSGPRK